MGFGVVDMVVVGSSFGAVVEVAVVLRNVVATGVPVAVVGRSRVVSAVGVVLATDNESADEGKSKDCWG